MFFKKVIFPFLYSFYIKNFKFQERLRKMWVVVLSLVFIFIYPLSTWHFIFWIVELSDIYFYLCHDRLGFGNLNGSLEQVQVELFEKQIFGGSKVSIFQYSMVFFWKNNHEGMHRTVKLLYLCYDLVCLKKN